MIRLYKSNSDAFYLQADDGPVWDMGNSPDPGAFAADAAAWADGEWEPDEQSNVMTTDEGLTLVATWDPVNGVQIVVDPDNIGGSQEDYLGTSGRGSDDRGPAA